MVNDYYTAIVEYNGESYLGATSFATSSRVVCDDLYRNFNDTRFPTMTMCVDFSEHEFPAMSFDLVQFRNTIELDFPEEVPFYAMTYVEWESPEASGQDVIFDQEEGALVNHQYQLPPNFKGIIKFKFYAYIGRQSNLTTSTFDEYDFNLMDNLKFYVKNFTSTKEIETLDFALIPNPANNEVRLDIEDSDFGKVSIYNNLGLLVQTKKIYGQNPVNINALSAGVYFVKFESHKNEKIYSSRLVKL